MTVVIPRLGELQKEGEAGYAKITQYTRYLTVDARGRAGDGVRVPLPQPGRARRRIRASWCSSSSRSPRAPRCSCGWASSSRSAGSATASRSSSSRRSSSALRSASSPGGTAARWRSSSSRSSRSGSAPRSSSSRKASGGSPIQYAKRMVGRKMTAGGSTYLPLRVNMAGVIPIIFAAAILAFPPTMAQYFPATPRLRQRVLPAGRLDLPLDRGLDDRGLHVLLHRGPVQPGRPGRQPAPVRRLHPGHPARAADGAVPRPRALAPDAAGLALPRGSRGAPEPLHRVRRVLAGELAARSAGRPC